MELRALNHTHIFYYPYLVENGFDLDTIQPGLQATAMPYKTHDLLKEKLKDLGEMYLREGNTLIHGDYYPGSWLKTAKGIKIIDPEFSHIGRAEFDLGVMIAHLKMANIIDAEIRIFTEKYQKPKGFDMSLLQGFCGAEIMRRLIGLAQLPLTLSLPEKIGLLQYAEQLIIFPEKNTLKI